MTNQAAKLPAIFGFVVLFLLVWGSTKLYKSATDWWHGDEIEEPVVTAALSGSEAIEPIRLDVNEEDQSFICRAAIAEIMGRPFEIIASTRQSDNTVRLQYTRPDDGTVWASKCRLNGNRIEWASIRDDGSLGRWRVDPADEVITYVLEDDGVTIEQKFADGSTISDTFKRD